MSQSQTIILGIDVNSGRYISLLAKKCYTYVTYSVLFIENNCQKNVVLYRVTDVNSL